MSPAPRPVAELLLRSQSDQRLWELATGGHPRAFTVLVQRHRGLFTVIAAGVVARSEVEDVIQEALARAWRALESGTQVDQPRAWLAAIVRRTAVEMVRSGSDTAGAEPDADVADPRWSEDSVHDRFEVRELLRALADLPENQRRVLVAAEIDGASRAQIAAAMQVSEGSVRALTHRARVHLRAAMTAIIPLPLLSRLLSTGTSAASSGMVETAGSLAGGTMLLKGGAVLLAVGAVGGGALHAVLGSGARDHVNSTALHHASALPGGPGRAAATPPAVRTAGALSALANGAMRTRRLDPPHAVDTVRSGLAGRSGRSATAGASLGDNVNASGGDAARGRQSSESSGRSSGDTSANGGSSDPATVLQPASAGESGDQNAAGSSPSGVTTSTSGDTPSAGSATTTTASTTPPGSGSSDSGSSDSGSSTSGSSGAGADGAVAPSTDSGGTSSMTEPSATNS
ncbi:MAG TPA: sigma-70 family RNA polymerase sigma factor [Solirubrobacteraceae bacterium]|nr:sigma-70 family RNA polymerase sigma factor [Solirubrobacteraceae bacterium]